MVNQFRRTWTVAAVAIAMVTLAHAQSASLETSLRNTDARRAAAERGVREVRSKTQKIEDARTAYAALATQQNAWLDVVIQSVRSKDAGAPTEPTAASEQAGQALATWLVARDAALGRSGSVISKAVTDAAVQDLKTIATETRNDNRAADDKKRDRAVAALNDRLRWKTWEQIR